MWHFNFIDLLQIITIPSHQIPYLSLSGSRKNSRLKKRQQGTRISLKQCPCPVAIRMRLRRSARVQTSYQIPWLHLHQMHHPRTRLTSNWNSFLSTAVECWIVLVWRCLPSCLHSCLSTRWVMCFLSWIKVIVKRFLMICRFTLGEMFFTDP